MDQQETRVYIVDDDQELCASLAWLLDSVNITSEYYFSVQSFLDEYRRDIPACLVLDVRMPEVGGFQLQEALLADESPIPIIFVSAHGDIKMSVRALQRGALTFIEKPYDPQHMLDVIQDALRVARQRFGERRNRTELQGRIDTLTVREREILALVLDGLPSKNIAKELGISVKTVDVHRTRIKEKTGAESIAVLVRDILQAGIAVT
ncbi:MULTISPECIES: response regulator transcription factor [Rhodococcus]|jgi:RNA polymerase sigma factor (sigma-70 family)|uniref:Response regulator, two-component system n=3 Tax=Rhodococcus TaxID=1827 RepID=Q0SCT5_RHOJR|nr:MULTISPECIES: response regulator [Rhodococcus]NDV08947.1 response regulator transcription factor [Rhodococcus sp. IEGM 248]ABG94651.1 response regulator, two-component system [Rhodococcus jostii RHA1]MCQ4118903.1 response regulator [Rhodococcus sp. FXJ9.536]MDI9948119.1 response regulator [Rhodococcus sp. IEGM 1305]MDI9974266.1 response regulator [Rhodococcus sp. IEGM 1307]